MGAEALMEEERPSTAADIRALKEVALKELDILAEAPVTAVDSPPPAWMVQERAVDARTPVRSVSPRGSILARPAISAAIRTSDERTLGLQIRHAILVASVRRKPRCEGRGKASVRGAPSEIQTAAPRLHLRAVPKTPAGEGGVPSALSIVQVEWNHHVVLGISLAMRVNGIRSVVPEARRLARAAGDSPPLRRKLLRQRTCARLLPDSAPVTFRRTFYHDRGMLLSLHFRSVIRRPISAVLASGRSALEAPISQVRHSPIPASRIRESERERRCSQDCSTAFLV